MPRFSVLCTLFPAATEYGFGMEVVDGRREVKGDSFLVVKDYEREAD